VHNTFDVGERWKAKKNRKITNANLIGRFAEVLARRLNAVINHVDGGLWRWKGLKSDVWGEVEV
jgi:hypothetical protein